METMGGQETDRFKMSDLSIEIGGRGNKRKSSFFRDNDSDWLAHVEIQPMTSSHGFNRFKLLWWTIAVAGISGMER